MRTLLASLAMVLLGLGSGCVPSPKQTAGPQLAHFSTVALAPVTFSTQQPLRNERDTIATVLKRDLTDRLQRKGYAVVAAGDRTAGIRLNIDITYIWDGRLYGNEHRPLQRFYPQLRLYGEVTLTDVARGKVLLRQQVEGEGLIEPMESPAPVAEYTAPQRDLARRISRLFPNR